MSQILPLPNLHADNSNENSRTTRNLGLDLIRIFGTILVVILHSAVPYLKIPMPGLVWPVHNSVSSDLVTVGFWSIECVIMPLFFVLAGYAAAAMCQKYGTEKYFWERQKRIVYPLLLAFLIILPIEVYTCAISWIAERRYPFAKIYSLKFAGEDEKNFWGLAHLWFLLYLGIYVAIHAWFQSRSTPKSSSTSLPSWKYLTAGFFGLFLCLFLTPRITLGFRHDFLPFATNLCYYGIWFTLGLTIFNFNFLQYLKPDFGRICCLASLVIFGLLYPVIKMHLEGHEQSAEMKFAAAILIPVYAIFLITGLLAISNSSIKLNSTWIKYLAGATFSIYLLHHPICVITQVGLHHLTISPLLKFLTVTCFSLTASLTLYECAIRKTRIGQILHGQTNKATTPSQPTQSHPNQKLAA